MKTIRTLSSKIEAEMIKQFLEANEIPAFVNGSREYASFITGSDIGTFNIEVSDENGELAESLLKSAASNNQVSLEKSTNSKASLRKAIILSFMGLIVIPILFNIFSIKPMIEYVHFENQKIKKYFWIFFYLVLQIGSAITALQLQHFNCSRFFTN